MQQAQPSKREQIIDETARLISERGYYGFGLQELATRCGLTKPGLLHHFKSKDQLLLEVLRDRDRHDQAAVFEAMAGIAGQPDHDVLHMPANLVRKALDAIVQRNAGQPELVRLYAVLRAEALNPGHPAHAWFNAREAATLETFTAMIAPHADQPESLARQIIGTMLGLELQWLRENQGFELAAEWHRQMERIWPRRETPA